MFPIFRPTTNSLAKSPHYIYVYIYSSNSNSKNGRRPKQSKNGVNCTACSFSRITRAPDQDQEGASEKRHPLCTHRCRQIFVQLSWHDWRNEHLRIYQSTLHMMILFLEIWWNMMKLVQIGWFFAFLFRSVRNKCSYTVLRILVSWRRLWSSSWMAVWAQAARETLHGFLSEHSFNLSSVQDFRTAGMGLDKAKSLLQVTQGFTFLDLLLGFHFGTWKRCLESSLPITKNFYKMDQYGLALANGKPCFWASSQQGSTLYWICRCYLQFLSTGFFKDLHTLCTPNSEKDMGAPFG